MKIFVARFVIVLWVITALISISGLISEISDGDFWGAVCVFFAVFALLSIITLIFSFLALGILDPRKVLSLLKDNK